MLDVTFPEPLSWPWRLFALLLLCISLGGIVFCTWREAYPLGVGFMLMLILGGYSIYAFRLVLWRNSPLSIIACRLLTDRLLEIRCRHGGMYQGSLAPGCLVTQTLLFLSFRAEPGKFRCSFILEAQALAAKDYRHIAKWVHAQR